MSAQSRSFSARAQARQRNWAREKFGDEVLEKRRGDLSWVLKREHQKCNLFRPEWWDHIAKREHRWARALNSSQCFAVNLFAPLKDGEEQARTFLRNHLKREVGPQDTVRVEFEFIPPGTKEWLGECDGQPTQIDVYFQVVRADRAVGYVLVEVKFTEASFGCCRGWNGKSNKQWLNPDRRRCEHVDAVVADPQSQCWLVQERGRRYWEIISLSDSSIREPLLKVAGACPFRHGLYQMMRNRILADELVRHTGASWADFVVCCHPENASVLELKEPVSSTKKAIDAFQLLSSSHAVQLWNAQDVVRAIGSTDGQLTEWKTWMQSRYFAD